MTRRHEPFRDLSNRCLFRVSQDMNHQFLATNQCRSALDFLGQVCGRHFFSSYVCGARGCHRNQVGCGNQQRFTGCARGAQEALCARQGSPDSRFGCPGLFFCFTRHFFDMTVFFASCTARRPPSSGRPRGVSKTFLL